MTLNYHALLTKNKFIVAMCLRDQKNNPIYDEENFEHSDSTILEEAIDLIYNNKEAY